MEKYNRKFLNGDLISPSKGRKQRKEKESEARNTRDKETVIVQVIGGQEFKQ